MSSTDFDIDSFLSTGTSISADASGYQFGRAEGNGELLDEYKEPGYEGNIDYRIRQLSYSSLLTLHQCPRKFELYRKRTTFRTLESEKSTVTFAFGHVVGEAIASVFSGFSQERIFYDLFTNWHAGFDSCDEKAKKSIYTAVFAIQKLIHLREQGFLEDYELVYYNGQPATELSFVINFPDGFRLRGFVDAVLRNKVTGEIIVLECKTTGSTTLNPATYKNSSQAIGYSVVLDVIYPDLSSYQVLYLIYQTKSQEYTCIPFEKTYLQRALWIRELLLEIETIKMYEAAEIYPMRGESCFNFGRECEYFQTCMLSTAYLTKPGTAEEVDSTNYQISIGLSDLLDAQFRKVGT